MTTEAEILFQIAGGEGQTCEFKRALDNPESMAGEIVAFANSEGGALFIGVDDDGSIVGAENPDAAFQTAEVLSHVWRRLLPASGKR